MPRPSDLVAARRDAKIAELTAENAALKARMAVLLKKADTENPAQPVPEPSATPPSQSTSDARSADTTTEVTTPGAASTDVAPDATTQVMTPGSASTNVSPDSTTSVTAPVSGGNEVGSYDQTVTLITPDASGANNGKNTDSQTGQDGTWVATGSQRVFASINLARLRIETGVSNETNDLALGERIARSKMGDEAIRAEIVSLSRVKEVNASRQAAAPQRTAARTTPSLASMASPISAANPFAVQSDSVLW